MEDPNQRFLALGVVHYLLIRGMVSLSHHDRVSMVSALNLYGYTLDSTYNEVWREATK